jgi:hypothetical protein
VRKVLDRHKDCAEIPQTHPLGRTGNSILIALTYLVRKLRDAAFFRTSVTKEKQKIANWFSKADFVDYIALTRIANCKERLKKPRESRVPRRNLAVKMFCHAVAWAIGIFNAANNPC